MGSGSVILPNFDLKGPYYAIEIYTVFLTKKNQSFSVRFLNFVRKSVRLEKRLFWYFTVENTRITRLGYSRVLKSGSSGYGYSRNLKSRVRVSRVLKKVGFGREISLIDTLVLRTTFT